MKQKELKKKKDQTESSTEMTDLAPGVKLHENGILYKEIEIGGLDEPVKLFNTLKPQRLKDETWVEYKIRRQFLNHNAKTKNIFYNPSEHTEFVPGKGLVRQPYVNKNKKDKFKKKKNESNKTK